MKGWTEEALDAVGFRVLRGAHVSKWRFHDGSAIVQVGRMRYNALDPLNDDCACYGDEHENCLALYQTPRRRLP